MPYSHLDENNGHKSFQLPGSRPHYNPDRPGQVEHVSLDLVLDIPNRSFSGTCAIRLNPVRKAIESLTLDAVDLQIDRVEIDGIDHEFNYDGELLHIPVKVDVITGKILDLVIHYGVTNPQRGAVTTRQFLRASPVAPWLRVKTEKLRAATMPERRAESLL